MSKRGECLVPLKMLNVASRRKLRAARGGVQRGLEAQNLRSPNRRWREGGLMFGTLGAPELLVVLIFVLLLVWPTWRILGKAGFPPAISLVALVPCAIFLLYLFLAFVEWPIQRRLTPGSA